jgi:putative hydrolase of the HAD superfamily
MSVSACRCPSAITTVVPEGPEHRMMIFFDIDETLINQRQAEAAALAHFLDVYGRKLPRAYSLREFCRLWRSLREQHAPNFFNRSISFSEHRRRRIKELFAKTEPRLSDREADARFAVYLERYSRSWTLFPDVLPCLNDLSGHTLGIISNGSAEQQRRKLRATGIADHFRSILISEDVGLAKPEGKIFAAACERVGCYPEDCVYVGDRLDADARGSTAAGLRGIWLDRQELEYADDVEVIHSLGELRECLAADESSTEARRL